MPRKLRLVVDDAFFAAEAQAAGLGGKENAGLVKPSLAVFGQIGPGLINSPVHRVIALAHIDDISFGVKNADVVPFPAERVMTSAIFLLKNKKTMTSTMQIILTR